MYNLCLGNYLKKLTKETSRFFLHEFSLHHLILSAISKLAPPLLFQLISNSAFNSRLLFICTSFSFTLKSLLVLLQPPFAIPRIQLHIVLLAAPLALLLLSSFVCLLLSGIVPLLPFKWDPPRLPLGLFAFDLMIVISMLLA